nr:MAG TPA: glycoprotein [Caudoviricetes sp.]
MVKARKKCSHISSYRLIRYAKEYISFSCLFTNKL